MRPDRRRRVLSAAVVSVAVHAALLAALVLHAPRLKIYEQPSGPPQAIIPILLVPPPPPPRASGPPPAPIRLHRRAQRFAPTELPVAPLVAPVTEAPPRPPAPPGPRTVTGPPAPDPGEANARAGLRALVGCANPNLLTRAEREKCEDRLAAGARDSPYLGTGIERDKARGLAAEAARKEANIRYRDAPATPNAAPGTAGIGQTAEEAGRRLGNDRPKATIPF